MAEYRHNPLFVNWSQEDEKAFTSSVPIDPNNPPPGWTPLSPPIITVPRQAGKTALFEKFLEETRRSRVITSDQSLPAYFEGAPRTGADVTPMALVAFMLEMLGGSIVITPGDIMSMGTSTLQQFFDPATGNTTLRLVPEGSDDETDIL